MLQSYSYYFCLSFENNFMSYFVFTKAYSEDFAIKSFT